jgi:hypothetical protein
MLGLLRYTKTESILPTYFKWILMTAIFATTKLEYGDILLNEGQSTELVGRPAMWRSEIEDCCFQNTLIRFQADCQRVIPEFALALFLRYYRAGEFAKISSKTSSVAHLGAGRFALMPFPVPPIKLQREFAKRVAAVTKLKDQCRSASAEPVCSCAFFRTSLHTRPRVQRASGIPRAL